MGRSGSSSAVSRQDVRGVFGRSDVPYTPLTTAEIAQKLDRRERFRAAMDARELVTFEAYADVLGARLEFDAHHSLDRGTTFDGALPAAGEAGA